MNTRRLALVALVVAASLGLAGCAAAGGASPAPSAAQGAPNGGNGFGRNGGNGFGGAAGAFPGASGLVAAVEGSTAQVQSATRQTAVTWTSSTRFTTQVDASSADLKTGDCVIARPARAAAGTGTNGQGNSGNGGSGSTTVAAATVVMFAPVNGACTAGFGGNRNGRPDTAPTPTPGNGTGTGTGRPGGGLGGFGFGATGTVKSISSGSFVVTETRGGTTRDETVTFDPTTSFSTQKAGTAADVVVGVCVLAQGKTDDTGALTATTIAVSKAVNGTCVTGFGGRGGFGGPTPNSGSSGASA